ncbi:UNVERIFIED_ORG: hypothetical protein GGE64_004911 [Rhizobium etli]
MDLPDIDASAWAKLETAAVVPQSGFRYLNLCSVDTETRPQARMIVLRAADRSARRLEFHTDRAARNGGSFPQPLMSRSSASAPKAGCNFGFRERSSFMGREAERPAPHGTGCPRERG